MGCVGIKTARLTVGTRRKTDGASQAGIGIAHFTAGRDGDTGAVCPRGAVTDSGSAVLSSARLGRPHPTLAKGTGGHARGSASVPIGQQGREVAHSPLVKGLGHPKFAAWSNVLRSSFHRSLF